MGDGIEVNWNVQMFDAGSYWIRGVDGRVRRRIRPMLLEERHLVGARTAILKGTTIDAGSVVGAATVVRTAAPARSGALGNSAEVSEWGSGSSPVRE